MNKEMGPMEKVFFIACVLVAAWFFVAEPTGPRSLTNFSSIGGEAAAEHYGW